MCALVRVSVRACLHLVSSAPDDRRTLRPPLWDSLEQGLPKSSLRPEAGLPPSGPDRARGQRGSRIGLLDSVERPEEMKAFSFAFHEAGHRLKSVLHY